MPAEDQPSTPEPQHYPELIARQPVDAEHAPVGGERLLASPEGYLELEHESRAVQQALALDFDIWASDLPDDKLQQKATPQLEKLNAERPNEPLTAENVNRRFLQHLIRPKWHEHFPANDSQEETDRWHEFVGQWPEHLQENLEELASIDGELRDQAADTGLMAEVATIRAERIEVMRSASDYLGAERSLKKLAVRTTAIRAQASLSNRSLTAREQKRIEAIGEHQEETRQRQTQALSGEQVIKEIAKRQALRDERDLRRGLLLTDSMQTTIDYILPSLLAGRPVLLVGETGGAKTALAKFVAREYVGKKGTDAEFISGHDEINSYQLTGKTGLKDGNTTFDQGPMLRAMEQGKPLILDEINAMPPGFLKRLNAVVQLRPGDSYIPQEDSGQAVVIRHGFCVIGTANEKSKRYKGVDDLSVEFQNRFGANVVRIGYPDANVPDGQPPNDNLRLALAFLRDRDGNIDPNIDLTEIGDFIRAAHITQKLFAGGDAPTDLDADIVRDGLKEAVIAPRTMIDILSKVKEGQPLVDVLAHFVAGFKNTTDRKALETILINNFFDVKESKRLRRP